MNSQKRKKGYFTYNGKSLSITEILKEPGVSEFLQKNGPLKDGPLKDGPLRNKLRRLFKVDGITEEMVDEYLEEQRQNNRNPFIILPRQKGAIEINDERMTAKQALERYPQLYGYLQPDKRLKKGTLHAKLIRKHRKGEIPDLMKTHLIFN